MDSLDELTLANLPSDIIRIIIKMHIGERMDIWRLVCKTWKVLVDEYFDALPVINQMNIQANTYTLTIEIEVCEKDQKYFEPLLPVKRFEEGRNDNMVQLDFYFELHSPTTEDELFRIFRFTSRITRLVMVCYNKGNLHLIRKTMRAIQISEIHIMEDKNQEIFGDIKEMIKRHKAIEFGILTPNILHKNMSAPITNLTELVECVFIQVSFRHSISNKQRRFWEKFAKYLVTNNKKGIVKVTILKDYYGEISLTHFYREPWLEFMDIFSALITF